jgi:hypothetical protein
MRSDASPLQHQHDSRQELQNMPFLSGLEKYGTQLDCGDSILEADW